VDGREAGHPYLFTWALPRGAEELAAAQAADRRVELAVRRLEARLRCRQEVEDFPGRRPPGRRPQGGHSCVQGVSERRRASDPIGKPRQSP